ncbi:MAG: hypothetical protein CL946_01955 [Ectothiorhodospiraceae bacterium]|nr:hypothetical protein [Ectothiorhodospiraceae bacterium]
MKHIQIQLLTVFGILVLAATASAQVFTVSANSAEKQGDVDSFLEPYVMVTNNTADYLNLKITVTNHTLPEGWTISMCLVNCFAPGVLDATDQMPPSSTHPLKFIVTTGSEPASGTITVSLSDPSDPFGGETIVFHVSTTTTGLDEISVARALTLAQNYPNPFSLSERNSTAISYSIPKNARASLKIYNLLGKEVRTLFQENRLSGLYTTIWDGRNQSGNLVPPGIYVYKLTAGNQTQTRRMLLTR